MNRHKRIAIETIPTDNIVEEEEDKREVLL
jgi:hypothetical protein